MTPTNPFDLSGRIALINGASRGIGAAIAQLLAQYGAHVILSSRKQGGCDDTADAIRQAGGSAESLVCHIGEMDQIQALADDVRQRHGRVDILVNNAATSPHFGPILDTDMGAFQKTVDVNIRGFFMMSTQIGRLMRANGGGVIVNVASINGVRPGLYQGIYSITKAAVISMTQAFAKECAADGIRVNALLPGLTDTKLASALTKNEKLMDQLLPSIPMQRVAQPHEMAGSVLYLVSDAASYTTGTCLNVDGGLLA